MLKNKPAMVAICRPALERYLESVFYTFTIDTLSTFRQPSELINQRQRSLISVGVSGVNKEIPRGHGHTVAKGPTTLHPPGTRCLKGIKSRTMTCSTDSSSSFINAKLKHCVRYDKCHINDLFCFLVIV